MQKYSGQPEELEESGELFEHYKFVVDPGQGLFRIDKFLFHKIEHISRSKIQAAAAAGNILVNGKGVKSNYRVKPADIISIVMSWPRRELVIIPQDIPLDLIYEDNDVIVINKNAGLVVHPGVGNYEGTLVNALAFKMKDDPRFDKTDVRAGLVHRLDKDTSGIMVIGKNDFAVAHLAKQFFDRTTDRKYIAVVWGSFDEPEGTITGNIGRHFKDRLKMDVFPDGDQGKHAVTHYRVIENIGYISVLECKLETGRTHQIRAHCAYIKHPIFNDEIYGGNQVLKGTTFTKYKQFVQNCFNLIPRQALHAKSLGFTHPVSGERMFFDSELPNDMNQLLVKWRNYIDTRN